MLGFFPDISTYELKTASKVIYGKDFRNSIPWNIDDIPISSCLRFFFEKMTGLIGHFPNQNGIIPSTLSKQEYEQILYECNKIYVDITTVLTIVMKCYSPSYLKRMKDFCDNYELYLPELFFLIPDLSEKVMNATKFKLYPQNETIVLNPIRFWFTARNDLMTVWLFFLRYYLNMEVNSIEDIPNKSIQEQYFDDTISILIGKRLKIKNQEIVKILSHVFKLIVSIRFFINMNNNYKYLNINLISYKKIPSISLYLIAPYILYSLYDSQVLNEPNFIKAKTLLNDIQSDTKNDLFSSWDDLKKKYLKIYKIVGGIR